MSEDVEEASKQQTRSGRSFGVGPVGDFGDLPAAAGTRPSPPAAHSVSSPLVEGGETQIALTATTTTESFASTEATQMDSPVSSPSPFAAREAVSNIISCTESVPITATVFKFIFFGILTHLYPQNWRFLAEKNSTIALLMSCQRSDLRKTLKYNKSRDLEGIQ